MIIMYNNIYCILLKEKFNELNTSIIDDLKKILFSSKTNNYEYYIFCLKYICENLYLIKNNFIKNNILNLLESYFNEILDIPLYNILKMNWFRDNKIIDNNNYDFYVIMIDKMINNNLYKEYKKELLVLKIYILSENELEKNIEKIEECEIELELLKGSE